MLSAVVCLSHRVKLAGAVNASFAVFEDALESGRLPAAGKVSDRLVRSAFAALGRCAPGLHLEQVPNPFAPPHNLAWYFGVAVCPPEIRQFVTSIGRKHLRVWSLAQDPGGWRVLVQVFGADSAREAANMLELESRMPARRLRGFSVSTVPYDRALTTIDDFLHVRSRGLLNGYGAGTFVEAIVRQGGI